MRFLIRISRSRGILLGLKTSGGAIRSVCGNLSPFRLSVDIVDGGAGGAQAKASDQILFYGSPSPSDYDQLLEIERQRIVAETTLLTPRGA